MKFESLLPYFKISILSLATLVAFRMTYDFILELALIDKAATIYNLFP